eukprot:364703-Chlamydomonas_euryale.AAC.8
MPSRHTVIVCLLLEPALMFALAPPLTQKPESQLGRGGWRPFSTHRAQTEHVCASLSVPDATGWRAYTRAIHAFRSLWGYLCTCSAKRVCLSQHICQPALSPKRRCK